MDSQRDFFSLISAEFMLHLANKTNNTIPFQKHTVICNHILQIYLERSTTYLNRNFDVLFLIRIIFFIDICKSNTKLFNSNCFYETFIKLNLTTKVLQTYIKIVYLQIESYTKDHGIKPLRLYFNKTNLSVPLAQLFPTQL